MMEFFFLVVGIIMLLLIAVLVFVFDDIVLNKHFTKKLHKKLGVG